MLGIILIRGEGGPKDYFEGMAKVKVAAENPALRQFRFSLKLRLLLFGL